MSPAYETHPLAAAFPPQAPEVYAALVRDVAEHGLAAPVVLREGMVLDGVHRLRACLEAVAEPVFAYYEGDDPAGFVVRKNLLRRDLNESQRAMLCAKLVDARAGGFRREGAAPRDETTAADAAEKACVSKRTMTSAVKVARKSPPEVVDAVMRGDLRVADAANVADAPKEEQREAMEELARGRSTTLTAALRVNRNAKLSEETMPPLTAGRFRAVVVDPPWEVAFGMDRSHRDRLMTTNEPPYPVMGLGEIKALPVADMLADDAWVFLWTIQQFLYRAPAVLEAWGAELAWTGAWLKPNGPQQPRKPCSNVEFVLAGKVGSPAFSTTKDFRMGFAAPNPPAHSAKPEEFVATALGEVRVKVVTLPDGSTRWKSEHDDIAAIATRTGGDYLTTKARVDREIARLDTRTR